MNHPAVNHREHCFVTGGDRAADLGQHKVESCVGEQFRERPGTFRSDPIDTFASHCPSRSPLGDEQIDRAIEAFAAVAAERGLV